MFFEIYKSREDDTYWWEAKGEDEQMLCSSEPMASKETCLAATLILKHSAAAANIYDQTGDQSGPIVSRRVDA
jgi:uncharacterized protein YegP (UPF0339 family)